jgi:hypothetical protein
MLKIVLITLMMLDFAIVEASITNIREILLKL